MEDFEEKLNSILSSPETMGQIMAFANSLSGGGTGEGEQEESPFQTGGEPTGAGENPFALLQDVDPAMLQRALGLFRSMNSESSEKTMLLQALRPFLREEKRKKLDKAIQYARFSRVLKTALRDFRGGQDV